MTPPETPDAPGTTAEPAPSAPAPRGLRNVQLPEVVVRGLEERMKGSSFDSVDQLIAFILGRLVDRTPGATAFSEEDEKVLKDRLRSLGYID